jgi:hypothetical protein
LLLSFPGQTDDRGPMDGVSRVMSSSKPLGATIGDAERERCEVGREPDAM